MELPDFLTQDADGEIRLTGHRIGIFTLVSGYQKGASAEQLAVEYPSLPLYLIRQVIAFYLDNQEAVTTYISAYGVQLERQASVPPGPGIMKMRALIEKLQAAKAANGADAAWSNLSLGKSLLLPAPRSKGARGVKG